MGQPTPPFNNRSLVYTSASAAAVFSPPIGWVQVITTGDVVLKGQDGVAVTYSACAAGDILVGPFSAFTSTTSSNIRLGDGAPPPGSTAVAVGIGALNTNALTAKAPIQLNLGGGILAAGTPMAAFADSASSAPGVTLTDTHSVGIKWNDAATQVAVWLPAILVPADMNTAVAPVLHLIAAKTGATSGDATTFTATAFAQSVAVTDDAGSDLGGTTTAMVGTATAKTDQHLTLTLGAFPAYPAGVSLSLKPTNGLLGTDDVTCSLAWIEYTRKLNVS